ncbi:transporter [Ganoderma sinense ZZ0214-1]|uniref:Transporter n=1 Tax=Ganoderma sinense ZZ0214-1 TaxID=1077348 RepID=A0A2G8S909_9APHY|nr:transporter [Ganoderma sinense ZZ0214-1]
MNRIVFFALSLSVLLALFAGVEAMPALSKRTSASDVKAYLAAHNTFRAKHGAAALKWNNTLAAAAQKEVNRCVFKHSGGIFGPYGGYVHVLTPNAENLAAGTGNFKIEDAIRSWTNEAPQYNPKSPVPSHFTQVVWKGSKQVGCAIKECSNIFDAKYGVAKFYACEYYPAGNVIGYFPKNVKV